MTDEQYERLFALAMKSRRFATIDGGLLTRGLITAHDLHFARRESRITASGIQRLRDRLLFSEGLLLKQSPEALEKANG